MFLYLRNIIYRYLTMTDASDTDELNNLIRLDCSNIPKFSLNSNTYQAKVVSVYDGDTITVVFKFAGTYYKWNCRLNDIDTPEMKSKIAAEKQQAIKARDFLREQILGKIIKITCQDFDKYGRLLVLADYNNTNINELMIDVGFAKSYSGGTKEEWAF
jgi:endonuclease YncB( thermonuclease family)